jgi:Holliday junction resolvase
MDDNYDLSQLRKKPKRKNSRAKGSTFERQVAKLLNDRFNTTEFSRSPGSGAFATTHTLPEHLKIYGDLITPLNFKYCIECKKGYNKENLYSLYNYRSDFWKFIKQCEKDSNKCNKLPMVIFKQDRQQTLAIVPSSMSFPDNKYIEINRDNKYYKVYLFDEILKNWDTMWFD